MVNKYYFINKFDTNNINKQDKQTVIIYRNYFSNIEENLILKIKKHCRKRNIKFYLSNNVKLAIKLDSIFNLLIPRKFLFFLNKDDKKIFLTPCISLILISFRLCADPIKSKFFLYEEAK